MKKLLLVLGSCIALALTTQAALPKPKARPAVVDSAALYRATVDSINGTFHYQQGHVVLPGGVGELTVPRGFRYLDSTQSGRVLNKLWHNPPQTNLGMLFPANYGPVSDGAWAYIIDYDPMGYVKDDDADDIDYNLLMMIGAPSQPFVDGTPCA